MRTRAKLRSRRRWCRLGLVPAGETGENIDIVGGVGDADVDACIELEVVGHGVGQARIEGDDRPRAGLRAALDVDFGIEPELVRQVEAEGAELMKVSS